MKSRVTWKNKDQPRKNQRNGGGGKEILHLVEQVKAGKLPSVNNGK